MRGWKSARSANTSQMDITNRCTNIPPASCKWEWCIILALISHSYADGIIQSDSGAGNELILQIPRRWISQTHAHALHLHHASDNGVYPLLEWVTDVQVVSFKVIQVMEMSSLWKYLADGYHKTGAQAFHLCHESGKGVDPLLEWVTHVQVVSYKVIPLLEISSLCKYLADGYYKHVHSHLTCIM